MGKNQVPDRWLDYKPMGTVIPGTRFLACKVPLKEAILGRVPEEERFGPDDLKKACPKLRLLVDLTNTNRYYSSSVFKNENIEYEKIFCPGHVLPPNSIFKKFSDVVNHFVKTHEDDPDAVIAVHCTHGVNRTGYFICRYMIEHLKLPPEEAVSHFQLARGHNIERVNYVNDLNNGCKGGSEKDLYKLNANHRSHNFMSTAQMRSEKYPRKYGGSKPDNFRDTDRGASETRRGSTREHLSFRGRIPLNKRMRTMPPCDSYSQNVQSRGHNNDRPQHDEDVEMNVSQNNWIDRESRNFPLKHPHIQSNPRYHRYPVTGERNCLDSNIPGSWRKEQISSSFNPSRAERFPTPRHPHHPPPPTFPMPNVRPGTYQDRLLNEGTNVTPDPGFCMKRFRRDSYDIASSSFGPEHQDSRIPGSQVMLDRKNDQGVNRNHVFDDRHHPEPPILTAFSWTPDRCRAPPSSVGKPPFCPPNAPDGNQHLAGPAFCPPNAPDGNQHLAGPVYRSRVFTPQTRYPNPATRGAKSPRGFPSNSPKAVQNVNVRGFRGKRNR